mmetsp:Transcript_22127/g.33207  ORF Transcript_22127/g.33207 Transcript_22127/m.33207 type:complete len:730 (-) Transcript_22127:1298-3487(-)
MHPFQVFVVALLLLHLADSQLVEGGYYVSGKTKSECGHVAVFCKNGIKTPVQSGYYTIGGKDESTRSSERICNRGHYCVGGRKFKCDEGLVGSVLGLSSSDCSQICPAGYFCPQASVNPRECGSAEYYCPEGSKLPTKVDEGFYSTGSQSPTTRKFQKISPAGYYAVNGTMHQCPSGTFGSIAGLSTPHCEGYCSAGFYCPIASTSPKQKVCGGPDVYCTANSTHPQQVQRGYYTSKVEDLCPPGQWREYNTSYPSTMSAISTTSITSSCRMCDEGTYKVESGNDRNLCLPCPKYSSRSNKDRLSCHCYRTDEGDIPETLHFDRANGKCVSVSETFISTDNIFPSGTHMTQSSEFLCEVGFICVDGVRYPCPAGFYCDSLGLTEVSGECKAGYYCEEGSSSSTAMPCGRIDVFCPKGSKAPIFSKPGYYTNAFNSTMTRDSEVLCPPGHWCKQGVRNVCGAGRWGNSTGLSEPECNGACLEGHYCPAGSQSMKEKPCGSLQYHCPEGSAEPVLTELGYYSAYVGLDAELKTTFDSEGMAMDSQIVCERGYICSQGIKKQCPPGTFGWQYGAFNETLHCFPCKAGYFCSGDPPATNATENKCGGAEFYCPEGSKIPRYVSPGYYSIGGIDDKTRTSERICDLGHYCTGGKKFACDKGKFGDTHGLKTKNCSGFCPAGSYCENAGTITPIECPPNTYSVPGIDHCIDCGRSDLIENAEKRCRTSRSCCQYK